MKEKNELDILIPVFNESENDWESSQTHKNFKLLSTTEVQSIKIDSLLSPIKNEDYKVIIKLDIEGNEMRAIQGALETIKKTSPLIIMEFSKYIFDYDENIQYFKNFLTSNNYSIYDTNKLKINLNDITLKINALGQGYDTIGNFYLIKNESKTIKNQSKIILNESR